MKVLILYQPHSEHARKVEEFVHDFRGREPSRQVDLVDVDSPEGTAVAELYGIMQYPGVLALTNAEVLLKSWQGGFPLMDELAYYTQEQ